MNRSRKSPRTGFPGLQRNREKKGRKRPQNSFLKILYLAVLTPVISPKNGDSERKTAIKLSGYMSLDFCSLSKRDGGGEVNNHTMENKLKNLCYPFIQNRLCQFSSANAHREKWGSCGAFSPFCGAKMGQISKCQSAVAGQRNSQRDWL